MHLLEETSITGCIIYTWKYTLDINKMKYFLYSHQYHTESVFVTDISRPNEEFCVNKKTNWYTHTSLLFILLFILPTFGKDKIIYS